MEKNILNEYVSRGLSTRAIAKKIGKTQSTVKYWLKKYGLKTSCSVIIKKHKCITCGDTNRENFYGKMKQQCKFCFNENAKERFRENRRRAIEYKGSKCEICGYKRCKYALEFHHLHSEKKDKNFKTMRAWSWERAKKEIANCQLLCANCHREQHERP